MPPGRLSLPLLYFSFLVFIISGKKSTDFLSKCYTPFPPPVILATVATCTLAELPVPEYEIKDLYGKVIELGSLLDNSVVLFYRSIQKHN